MSTIKDLLEQLHFRRQARNPPNARRDSVRCLCREWCSLRRPHGRVTQRIIGEFSEAIQCFSRLAIVALVFGPLASQAQTSPFTAAYDLRVATRDAERDLDRVGTDADVASTNGRVMAGFEFLRRIDKRVITEFANAWKSSGSGNTGREAVVLIFRMADGTYRGVSQGNTYEYHKFSFSWRPNALAIVHTHPNTCESKPSPHDQRIAEQYHVPIFTITLRGMYVYNPVTRMTSKLVNDLDWLKLSKWQETDTKLKGCVAQGIEPCYSGNEERLLSSMNLKPSAPAAMQTEPPPLSQVDIIKRQEANHEPIY